MTKEGEEDLLNGINLEQKKDLKYFLKETI
jgi:hypothetical protein